MRGCWFRRSFCVGRRRASIDPAEVPLGTLVLEIAQTCNLRCAYCYAGGGSYGGEARVMRPELARRAARFLVESSGDRESVTLVLFGGEPLLNLAGAEGCGNRGRSRDAGRGQEAHRFAHHQRNPIHAGGARLPA